MFPENPSLSTDREVGQKTVIGLTGSIAAGKSTVASLLKNHGAHVIDADRVYRSLLVPGSVLWDRLVESFGSDIVAGDEIDRAALADIVFHDPAALVKLERITHPEVVARVLEEIAQSTDHVTVIEAVKLIQSGLAEHIDSLWVITAEPEVRLRRLQEHRGLKPHDARARMAASESVVPSCVRPDEVIDNSGDLGATRAAVETALERLLHGQDQATRVRGRHIE